MAEISRKITNVNERLFAYLQVAQPPEHEQLGALRERTRSMPDGVMQITPEQGHLLAFLVRLIAARRTLEIGTFTGYSALAVALALPADGRVIACDLSQEWTAIGRGYWARAGVTHKIDLRIGNAVDVLAARAPIFASCRSPARCACSPTRAVPEFSSSWYGRQTPPPLILFQLISA